MENTEAVLPEECPNPANHQGSAIWLEMPGLGFYSCQYGNDTPERCKWPVNKWTPESDSYAQAEVYVTMWMKAWGYA